MPGEEQCEGEPTKEHDTENRDDAKDIGSGVTESEQVMSYTEQEDERDNNIGCDDHGGKKPKLWPGQQVGVHTLVYMHMCAGINIQPEGLGR